MRREGSQQQAGCDSMAHAQSSKRTAWLGCSRTPRSTAARSCCIASGGRQRVQGRVQEGKCDVCCHVARTGSRRCWRSFVSCHRRSQACPLLPLLCRTGDVFRARHRTTSSELAAFPSRSPRVDPAPGNAGAGAGPGARLHAGRLPTRCTAAGWRASSALRPTPRAGRLEGRRQQPVPRRRGACAHHLHRTQG